jgi:hypothetical protein
VKIAKPTVEISDKVRLNLEKFVWSTATTWHLVTGNDARVMPPQELTEHMF